MEIHTFWIWQAPERITGPAVVIDAYAATTNIVTFLSQGATLFLIDPRTLDVARRQHPDGLIAGESLAEMPVGFELPNAPSVIAKSNLSGKTILYMSINGTRTIEAALARGAQPVIACAFTNVTAVAEYLTGLKYEQATVLLSGDDQTEVLEDRLCADVLTATVYGKPYVWDTVRAGVTRFVREYYSVFKGNENISVILKKDKHRIVPVSRKDPSGIIAVQDDASR